MTMFIIRTIIASPLYVRFWFKSMFIWFITRKFKKFGNSWYARIFTKNFGRLISFQYWCKVRLEDPHNLFSGGFVNKKYIFMPNHVAYEDIIMLFQVMTGKIDFRFLSKKSVSKNKFLKFLILFNRPFFIDRESLKERISTIKKVMSYLNEKQGSLIIFPEGTRNKNTGVAPLVKNTFLIAKTTKTDIVPVSMVDNRISLNPRIKGKKITRIIFHKPISYSEYNNDKIEETMKKVRNIISAPLNFTSEEDNGTI